MCTYWATDMFFLYFEIEGYVWLARWYIVAWLIVVLWFLMCMGIVRTLAECGIMVALGLSHEGYNPYSLETTVQLTCTTMP